MEMNEIGIVVITLIVIIGIIIVIGVCISNITTIVAKNSGMDEASAKKLGKNVGTLGATVVGIVVALLCKSRR